MELFLGTLISVFVQWCLKSVKERGFRFFWWSFSDPVVEVCSILAVELHSETASLWHVPLRWVIRITLTQLIEQVLFHLVSFCIEIFRVIEVVLHYPRLPRYPKIFVLCVQLLLAANATRHERPFYGCHASEARLLLRLLILSGIFTDLVAVVGRNSMLTLLIILAHDSGVVWARRANIFGLLFYEVWRCRWK